tara:strand:+ start:245 stop:847 length:603 start_codon:yes stop_codon:yes gene_type:complete
MKSKLNIFSNINLKNFLITALSKYEINIMDLEKIKYDNKTIQANVIILNNNKEVDLINFSKFSENYLIMANTRITNLKSKNNLKLLNTPMPIDYIKSSIKNFLQNLKIQFCDISIDNEKLTNLDNKSFCYLTKAELEILSYLLREKEASKKFIKENILNIRSSIETNSLESHLSRIRKKLNKVKSVVKIQTKSEKLLITV